MFLITETKILKNGLANHDLEEKAMVFNSAILLIPMKIL